MSRTYKDRRKDYRRIPKSKLYKSILHIYGEDMKHKRKDRTLNRLLRKRLKDIEESRWLYVR